MSDIYELMENAAEDKAADGVPFDKEAWAQRKRQEREEVFALADEAALKLNADPVSRAGYAEALGALHSHSATNVLLAWAQRPDVTRVGDSRFWAQKGASIKKGEKGIAILEPGREYVRDDGSVGTFYNVKRVFDASQTTARPRLGRRNEAADVLTAMVMNPPCDIVPAEGPVQGGVRYDPEADVIDVQKGLGERDLLAGLLVECAHASLARSSRTYNREGAHPQAVLAAAAAAKRFGIESPVGELPPLAPQEADAKAVREALNGARSAASDLGGLIGEALSKSRVRDEPVR